MGGRLLSIARIVIGASALVCLTGCATISRGTTEQFHVTSEPSGAQVRTSNGFTCEATPCEFNMQRKTGFSVTVSKAGFSPATVAVKSEMAGAGAAGMAGNVLIGGVIGLGIDATSGATRDLRPNPLHVILTAQPNTEAQATP